MPASSGAQKGTDMSISKGVFAESATELRLPSLSRVSGASMLWALLGALALPNIAAAEYFFDVTDNRDLSDRIASEAHTITGATEDTFGAPLEKGAEEAFPGRSGKRRKGLFETPRGRVELKYQVIHGQPVFEGDILLPVRAGNLRSKAVTRSAGVSALGRRWPHSVVPVEDSGLARDARVTQAIHHWQDRTSLRFVIGRIFPYRCHRDRAITH